MATQNIVPDRYIRSSIPTPLADHIGQLPGNGIFGNINGISGNSNGIIGAVPNNGILGSAITGIDPFAQKVNLGDRFVKPKDFIDHIKFLTLAHDFLDGEQESGLIKLNIMTPEFLKNNMGLILFTGNSSDPNYMKTLKIYHNINEVVSSARRNGQLKIDFPLGIIDIDDKSAGGETLRDYFKITSVPTIVYKSQDGNYHHFNGPKSLISAMKHACQTDFAHVNMNLGPGGLCNIVDLEEYKFEDPKPIIVPTASSIGTMDPTDIADTKLHDDVTVGAKINTNLAFSFRR